MESNDYLLLVEDNSTVQSNNKKILERHGYTLQQAMTLSEARSIITKNTPRAIILDIMLPDGNGLDFLRELRQTANIPVLLLTALGTPDDIVAGLETGGDDYLPKPYDLHVFLAKVRALLRRGSIMPESLSLGPIRLDMLSNSAHINGVDLLLSQREFFLLLLFAQNEERTMSMEYLYNKVWGQPMTNNTRAITNMVYRLRKAIEGSGYDILSMRNQGYCFRMSL